HQIRLLLRRADGRHRAGRLHGGLGGRTRVGDRTARPPGGARRCLGSRRRTDGRAGPLRAHGADGRSRPAVQPRKVLSRLQSDGAVAGHPGRVRGSRRPGARLQHQRGSGAERAHLRSRLAGPGADRRAVGRGPARTRRHHLHRHPGRGRRRPPPAALPRRRRGARQLDRGHRRDAPPTRSARRPHDGSPPMNIVIIGRGNVGGGLARLWSASGHTTTALGRDGGDASTADVVVIAVPGDTIEAGLATVSGASGKVTIDATNAFGPRDGAFPSLAHQVKSIIGGPVAKRFNTNYAALYDEIGKQRVRPSNLFAADLEARPITEQLIRDAGYDPVFLGGLEAARLVEDYLLIGMAVGNRVGPYFYRMAAPG